MTGTLTGVGVGPGDPQLITLKGAEVLRRARHIAYMTNQNGEGMARRIAGGFIQAGTAELDIVMPMRVAPSVVDQAYNKACSRILEVLESGEDVVFLCEGDPLFYGSFIHVQARLGGKVEIRVVPGIASPMAAAAALNRPLVTRNDILTVLPATLPEETIHARIAGADTVVFMKVGRHMAKLRRILEGLSLAETAGFVERATG
ncbi:MAG: precorrin-2 C(20)-methyltransferase, partial [Rhodospirillales bacterium]|nr:precorrin-2 C(20)-methyltransferase [Rhodospirillales bacterium]